MSKQLQNVEKLLLHRTLLTLLAVNGNVADVSLRSQDEKSGGHTRTPMEENPNRSGKMLNTDGHSHELQMDQRGENGADGRETDTQSTDGWRADTECVCVCVCVFVGTYMPAYTMHLYVCACVCVGALHRCEHACVSQTCTACGNGWAAAPGGQVGGTHPGWRPC